jgi:hypothetical protein
VPPARAVARIELGIADDAVVALLFGQLRADGGSATCSTRWKPYRACTA